MKPHLVPALILTISLLSACGPQSRYRPGESPEEISERAKFRAIRLEESVLYAPKGRFQLLAAAIPPELGPTQLFRIDTQTGKTWILAPAASEWSELKEPKQTTNRPVQSAEEFLN